MSEGHKYLDFLNNSFFSNEDNRTASWLNGFDEPVWLVDGRVKINWDRTLPDGSNFLAEENRYFLTVCRTVLFDARNLPSARDMSADSLKKFAIYLLVLVDWLIINGDLYKPKKYAFGRLDSDGIKSVIRLYVQGGSDAVRFVAQRLGQYFSRLLKDKSVMQSIESRLSSVPNSLLTIRLSEKTPQTFCSENLVALRAWLFLGGYYEGGDGHKGRISNAVRSKFGILHTVRQAKILSLAGIEAKGYISPAVILFLRQFEVVSDYEKYELLTVHNIKAYLPDGYLTVVARSKVHNTIDGSRCMTGVFKRFKAFTSFVEGLPEFGVLDSVNYEKEVIKAGAQKDGHTRTTPVEIALQSLGSSIDYLLDYGEAIVDAVIEWKSESAKLERSYLANGMAQNSAARAAASNAFEAIKLSDVLTGLNIKSLYSYWGELGLDRNDNGGQRGGELCRAEMTLEDSFMFLLASIYIITAAMSARRRRELAGLGLDSVKGAMGNYAIYFWLAKANFNDERVMISRPIPDLAARGIFLWGKALRRWGEATGKLHYKNLFCNPFNSSGNGTAGVSMDAVLSRFSDYIGLPVSESDRRWYHKHHEFRRFFAIVFFWQYKFANLSAISWMLGHVDVKYTYSYIREIVGGTEMTAEEARFSADAIRNGCGDDDALKYLRQLALSHFGTNDISLLEEDDLELYLEYLLEEGVYSVKPHAIETADGIKHEMLFEIINISGEHNE